MIPVLLYILFILNMIDATLTSMIISDYGTQAELNPIMRFVLEQFGLAGMYLMKAFMIAFLGLGLWIQNNESSAKRILIALNICFVIVIAYTSHLFD